jgi:hypothetical protein
MFTKTKRSTIWGWRKKWFTEFNYLIICGIESDLNIFILTFTPIEYNKHYTEYSSCHRARFAPTNYKWILIKKYNLFLQQITLVNTFNHFLKMVGKKPKNHHKLKKRKQKNWVNDGRIRMYAISYVSLYNWNIAAGLSGHLFCVTSIINSSEFCCQYRFGVIFIFDKLIQFMNHIFPT